MILLAMVSLLVGAALGQRFRVMVLMPATVIVLALAIGQGVTQAYSAWWTLLMAAAAGTSVQIGYFVGLGIHHFLTPASSNRSSSPTASKAPTSAFRSAPNHQALRTKGFVSLPPSVNYANVRRDGRYPTDDV
jgi:hypothetical protein